MGGKNNSPVSGSKRDSNTNPPEIKTITLANIKFCLNMQQQRQCGIGRYACTYRSHE